MKIIKILFIIFFIFVLPFNGFSSITIGILPLEYIGKKHIDKNKSKSVNKILSILLSKHKKIKNIRLKRNQRINGFETKYLSKLNKIAKMKKCDYLFFGTFEIIYNNELVIKFSIYDKAKNSITEPDRVITLLPPNSEFLKAVQLIQKKIEANTINVIFGIESSPHNVDVYHNNKWLGKTPLKELSAPEGNYKIKLVKRGYQKKVKTIKLTKNSKQFKFYLKKEKPTHPMSISFKYSYPYINNESISSIPFLPLLFSGEIFFSYFSFSGEIGVFNFNRKSKIFVYNDVSTDEQRNWDIVIIDGIVKYHPLASRYFLSPYIGIGGGVGFIQISEEESMQTHLIYKIICGTRITLSESMYLIIEGSFMDFGRINIGKPKFNPFGKKYDKTDNFYAKCFTIGGGIGFFIY